MNRLTNTIWDKKIPSLMGILLIVAGFGTITWLSSNVILFGTKAATAAIPQAVTITNISDRTFSVTYLTNDKAMGSLAYGVQSTKENTALDDRDQQTGTPSAYRVHQITANGLQPSTKYSFTITSGDQQFTNNGAPYEVTTAPAQTEASTTHPPLKGDVALEDGSIPTEALAFVSTNTSQLLSAIAQQDGSYVLPIGHLLSKDLTTPVTISPETTFHIVITNASLQSLISFRPETENTIPMVILSKNYDFTAGNDPLASPTGSASADRTGFPLKQTPGTGPEISTPTNNQTLDDRQPTFTGKAVPNTTVTITINSTQEITATVQADDTGNWKYEPDEPLEPGDHSITITSPDISGIMQTITNSFVVHAEGSQFTEPSVKPSKAPSPTTSIVPTMIPTDTPSPTISPTTLPPTATVSAHPTLAPTGSTSLIVSLVGIIGVVGIGALLFFFTMI